jgi:hypothetical protein
MTNSRLRLAISRTDLVLIVWFTIASTWRVIRPAVFSSVDFGWDAVIYARAARALVEGADPWSAGIPGTFYAGPPPSLIPFIPFAYLPQAFVQVTWVSLAAVSAIYVIRRLNLAWWWLMFPPLLLAVAAGSSALPLVALMVRGGAVANAGAVVGRIYSAVPLVVLGKIRPLVIATITLIVTAPFLAWGTYLAEFPRITELTRAQASNGGFSATAVPILIPVAVIGLWLIGRKRAAWLAVPALWPNAQEYYAVIALPIAASVPIATFAMATPLTPGIIAVGVFAQGLFDRWQARRDRRAGATPGDRPAGATPDDRRAGATPGASAPDHRATVDEPSTAHPS